MIAHIHSDGSIGWEYEIGDRVILTKAERSFSGGRLGYTGLEGKVIDLDRGRTYHTAFPWVELDNGALVKHLNSAFSPAPGYEPNSCIIESEAL